MTHTATPWKGPCEPDSNFQKGKVTIKSTEDGEVIATLSGSSKGRANAAFIVKAVNGFEPLVEALKQIEEKSALMMTGQVSYVGFINAAARTGLAKAEGRT